MMAVALIACNGFSYLGTPLPKLHIEGKDIKDSCGNKVILRGYNLEIKFSNDQLISYIDDMTDQSLDNGFAVCVRLCMIAQVFGCSNSWNVADKPFDSTAFASKVNATLIPVVNHCAQRGIYCDLDWHFCSDWNNTLYDDLYNGWRILCSKSEIKNKSHVIFNLCNEPISGPGGDITFTGYSSWIQPIVTKIRGDWGCDNIIIPAAPYWSSSYEGIVNHPITGGNILYSVHLYPHGACSFSDALNYGKFADLANSNLPWIFEEAGWYQADMCSGANAVNDFASPFFAYCDNNKIGMLFWTFAGDGTFSPVNAESRAYLYDRRNSDLPQASCAVVGLARDPVQKKQSLNVHSASSKNFFDITGKKVSGKTGLHHGIYIIRQNNMVKKRIVGF